MKPLVHCRLVLALIALPLSAAASRAQMPAAQSQTMSPAASNAAQQSTLSPPAAAGCRRRGGSILAAACSPAGVEDCEPRCRALRRRSSKRPKLVLAGCHAAAASDRRPLAVSGVSRAPAAGLCQQSGGAGCHDRQRLRAGDHRQGVGHQQPGPVGGDRAGTGVHRALRRRCCRAESVAGRGVARRSRGGRGAAGENPSHRSCRQRCRCRGSRQAGGNLLQGCGELAGGRSPPPAAGAAAGSHCRDRSLEADRLRHQPAGA